MWRSSAVLYACFLLLMKEIEGQTVSQKCTFNLDGKSFTVSAGGPVPSMPTPWQLYDSEFIYAFSLCGPMLCGAFPYSAGCRRPASATQPQSFELIPIGMTTPTPNGPSRGYPTLLVANDILQLNWKASCRALSRRAV